MKTTNLKIKQVNYKVKCRDTTIGKIYECTEEYYHPNGSLLLILITDDAGDEHSVNPDYFEKIA